MFITLGTAPATRGGAKAAAAAGAGAGGAGAIVVNGTSQSIENIPLSHQVW